MQGRHARGERSALSLVGMEGTSYEEVAAALDVPMGTIRSGGSAALRQLMGLGTEEERPSWILTQRCAAACPRRLDLRSWSALRSCAAAHSASAASDSPDTITPPMSPW